MVAFAQFHHCGTHTVLCYIKHLRKWQLPSQEQVILMIDECILYVLPTSFSVHDFVFFVSRSPDSGCFKHGNSKKIK